MNIIELAKQAGILEPVELLESNQWRADTIRELEVFAHLVRAAALEEAAKQRAAPPRQLPKRGSGALLDEQQHCYEMGYREGKAAVRAAIRQRKEKT